MDISRVFGSVGIAPEETDISNLNVDLVDNVNRAVGATGNQLYFRFSIKRDLWKHDMFRLTIDDNWRVETGATCSSADYTGKYNHYNGTRTDDPHYLDCVVTEKTTDATIQSVYIYGLNTDIDVTLHEDYKFVDLRVTSVRNPDADYTGNAYIW
jgi:hypothetical protein